MSNKRFGFLMAIATTVCLLLGAMSAVADGRGPSGNWQVETCYTNECIRLKLNSLAPEAAADAKLTTWNDKTYVWYRE